MAFLPQESRLDQTRSLSHLNPIHARRTCLVADDGFLVRRILKNCAGLPGSSSLSIRPAGLCGITLGECRFQCFAARRFQRGIRGRSGSPCELVSGDLPAFAIFPAISVATQGFRNAIPRGKRFAAVFDEAVANFRCGARSPRNLYRAFA